MSTGWCGMQLFCLSVCRYKAIELPNLVKTHRVANLTDRSFQGELTKGNGTIKPPTALTTNQSHRKQSQSRQNIVEHDVSYPAQTLFVCVTNIQSVIIN